MRKRLRKAATAALQITRAKQAGIVYPVKAYRAAAEAGLPFHIACAYLEKETAGGHNVYGHDPTQFDFPGYFYVTEENYKIYKMQRKREHSVCGRSYGMQGVGPMQLTYYTIQDDADAAGGCWKPYVNMLTGFKLIMAYRNQGMTWIEVGTRYNGSPTYGASMKPLQQKWRAILNDESE